VRNGNVERLKRGTGVEWVHSAAINGEGEEVDGEEVRRLKGVLEGMQREKQNDVSKDQEMEH
jgi:copper homeostasis protein